MKANVFSAITFFVVGTLSAALGQETKVAVPVVELGKGYELIGRLHEPLGKVVRVKGFVVEGSSKGFDSNDNFRVQRINGKATQEYIQLQMDDETHAVPTQEKDKIRPQRGKSYELEGYETGGFVGHPDLGAGPFFQTVPHYFRLEFCFVRVKEIPAVTFTPADFIGRRAILQGIARDKDGQAIMDGEQWQVIVNPKAPWPKEILEKKVETLGMYNPGKPDYDNPKAVEVFTLIDGSARPVDLADQVGQKVELRGRATSRNGVWWFEFRDQDIYVENLEEMPGWSEEVSRQPIVIRGVLAKAKLPRVDQVSVKANRNLRDYYIVRQATWAVAGKLLGPEEPTLQRWIATNSIDDKDE
ncbi:hypothetical protein [Anatilimnocola floriformis]|uniref:hypothetical protein n=1 Tax=Anatilimnocola floriformis TaxID=2948575 RepID=UPI0020C4AB72|nr:hypothetical protein [Anatilimnocola floriformis]